MKTKKTDNQNDQPSIEELEPRILFSAGLEGIVLDGLTADGDAFALYQHKDETTLQSAANLAAESIIAARQELVFIDTNTPDYQTLVEDLLSNNEEDRTIHWILIDSSRDGIQQITDALTKYNDLNAVHIISHGSDGNVQLGNSQLDLDSLLANTGDITNWGDAFSEDGDLLFYGCELAATEDGKALINNVAKLTGADVAASDDLTGSATLGGDWELEYKTGSIETSIALDPTTQAGFQSVLPANNAPVLDSTPFPSLTSITDSEINNAGNLVSSILSTYVTDADGDPEGIAINGAAPFSGTGTWQYSLDSGANWSNVGLVNNGLSLLLRDTDMIRYIPTSNGNNSAGITYRAWDQTSGVAGSKVDSTTNGGTTAFSSAGEFATITIFGNDAPILGNGNLSAVNEDTANPAGESVATIFTGQFSDIDAGSSFGGIAVVGNTANPATEGVWQYSSNSGTNWFDIGVVADGATSLALDTSTLIRFVPVANYNGTPTALNVRGLDNTYAGSFSNTAGSETRINVDTTNNGNQYAIAASTSTLSTSITAVNDAPVINDQTFNIDENRPMNNVVGTPVVADPDTGDTFTYSITGGTGATAFSIHATNGQIRVADPSQINFETNPVLTLDIQVQDAGGLIDTATVTININDLNERPTLNNAAFTLDENSANGTSAGTMVGTDPDGGDSLTYSIVGGNIGNAFAIDPVTGEITVNDFSALNFEAIGNMSSPAFAHQTGVANPFTGITVGSRSAPAFVDIDGDGDLDAVVGEGDGNLNFFENIGDATNPSFVQVSGPGNPLDSVDVTSRSTPTFADIDNDGDQDVFVGHRWGGIAFYENIGSTTSPSFVQVTGVGNPLNGVNVSNMAAPTFIDIDGDGDLDTFIGEWYGTVKYFENTGDAVNPIFTQQTGAANPLNGVSAPICCSEWTPKPTFTDLDDDGDYDAFIGLKNGTTEHWENTGDATTAVFSLQTGDANPLDTVFAGGSDVPPFYTGNEAAPAFVDIDSDGDMDVFLGNSYGTIRFFENKPVFNLTVRAEDSSGLTDTAVVQIDLDDVNEGPTDIDLSNNLIDEIIDTTGGYSVGTLSTTDEDGGEAHTYTIVGGTDAGLFSIGGAGNDELMLDDGAIDFETQSNYQVMVRVTDSGSPGLTYDETFTIMVNDLNDAPIAVDDRPALDFDGIDDHVQIANNPNLVMTNTLTLETWINPRSVVNPEHMILNKEGEYEFAIRNGTIHWAFDNTDPGWAWHDTGYAPATSDWTHIAITYNNGIVNTYANGNLVDTYNGSGTIGDNYPALNDLSIGGRTNNPAGKYFEGQIDDVRIWNTVRTQSEIASNLTQTLTGTETGLVGYWQFNEGSGDSASDNSIQNNDGLLGSGVAGQSPAWTGQFTNEDTVLNVSGGPTTGILLNDSDEDGDTLTASLVSGPSNAASFNLLADGSFTYTPNSNFNGMDSFTYAISDGNSGTDTATVYLNVTPVNDAPILTTPASDLMTAGTARFFSSANGNALSVADIDDPNAIVEVTLVTSQGSLTLGSNTGLSFTTGNGTQDASMTFTGTITAINAALEGLQLVTGTVFQGNVSLTLSVNDLGNTGGPSLNAASVIAISVSGDPSSTGNTNPPDTTPPGPDENPIDTDPVEPPMDDPVQESSLDLTPNTDTRGRTRAGTQETAPASFEEESSENRIFDVLAGKIQEIPADVLDTAINRIDIPKTILPIASNFAMWSAIDAMLNELDDNYARSESSDLVMANVVRGATWSLSAGFVAWILRGGSLIAAAMSSIPLWKGLDPLPIIAMSKHDRKKLEEEKLVDKQEEDSLQQEIGEMIDGAKLADKSATQDKDQ